MASRRLLARRIRGVSDSLILAWSRALTSPRGPKRLFGGCRSMLLLSRFTRRICGRAGGLRMTTGKRTALNAVLFIYCAGMIWLAYEIIADSDIDNRRLQRL